MPEQDDMVTRDLIAAVDNHINYIFKMHFSSFYVPGIEVCFFESREP